MNKKVLTIFLTLFLLSVLLMGCSNKDKTAPKGIEQFNGNTYVSENIGGSQSAVYVWVSVKDSKVAIQPSQDTTEPVSKYKYIAVTGSGAGYTFTFDNGGGDIVAGSLNFASDGSSVTVTFTKDPILEQDKPELLNTPIKCNKK